MQFPFQFFNGNFSKIQILISENEDKTLSDIGIDFSTKKRTTIKLVPVNHSVHRRSAIVSEADSTLPSSLDDEELALGASASPVEPTSSPIPLPLFSEEPVTRNHNDSISLYPCKFHCRRLHQFDFNPTKKLTQNCVFLFSFCAQPLPLVRHPDMLV